MQADIKISLASEAVNTANAFTGMPDRGPAENRCALFSPQLYYRENEMRKQRPTIIRESAMLIASCSHVRVVSLIGIIYGRVEKRV